MQRPAPRLRFHRRQGVTLPGERYPGRAVRDPLNAPSQVLRDAEISLSWRVGLAAAALHHQDRSLVELELGLFGVFDGVGAFARSGEAAQVAAEVIGTVCRVGDRPPGEALVAGCEQAETLIRERALGATTAAVVWVAGPVLWYVSVGDSRLYHQPAQAASLTQVTTDEGEGNILFNALGEGPDRFDSPVVAQHGAISLGAGDKLVLVTDGVTGDFRPDLLTAGELTSAIQTDDPQSAAERLLEIARKRDDRSALVIFIDRDEPDGRSWEP